MSDGSRWPAAELAEALRLIVITDERLVATRPDGRSLRDVVISSVEAGARCVQLRMKHASAYEMAEAGRAMIPEVRSRGGLFFVNDRADVAHAIGADGVHLGPDDVPTAGVRHAFGDELLIGWSTDDAATARSAEAAGADYLGCGAVFGTTSKDVGDEAIGSDRLRAVVKAVSIPVVGIGGITPDRAATVRATGAVGVAAIGAVMTAPDVGVAVRGLLDPSE